MNYHIRTCTYSDAEALCLLNNEEMGYSFSLDDTAKALEELLRDNSQRIFVAACEDAVIGYIHAADYRLLYASPSKNILGIAVSSRFRNKGVGRALLTAVENWAKESGCSSVRLTSGVERNSAHAFYRKCGYEFIKQQLNFKKILQS